jgi:hypothetical protein
VRKAWLLDGSAPGDWQCGDSAAEGAWRPLLFSQLGEGRAVRWREFVLVEQSAEAVVTADPVERDDDFAE